MLAQARGGRHCTRTLGAVSESPPRDPTGTNGAKTAEAVRLDDGTADWLKPERADGWASEQTGYGTVLDKGIYHLPVHHGPLDDVTLEALFVEDELMARGCEVRPEEMLRRDYEITIEPDTDDEDDGDEPDEEKDPKAETVDPNGAARGDAEDDVDDDTDVDTDETPEDRAAALLAQVDDEEDDEASSQAIEDAAKAKDYAEALGLGDECTDGMVWANAFGGAATFIGAIDGLPLDSPLDESNIKTIRFLTTYDRRFWEAHTYRKDPVSGSYGEVELYRFVPLDGVGVGGREIIVHRSRLLIWPGVRTPRTLKRQNRGWEYSLMQRGFSVLQQFAGAWASVFHRLSDFSQAIWKMQGLRAATSSPNGALVKERMDAMERARSNLHATLIEKDKEEFEYQTASFEGVKELLDLAADRVCAVFRTPKTVFFGMSPGGLNATGESDFRGWYDSIARERKTKLTPNLVYAHELIFLAKDGPTGGVIPKKWEIDYPPLQEPTETEEADLRKKSAETDEILIRSQVILPEEAALSHFTPQGWKADLKIDRDLRRTPAPLHEDPNAQPPQDQPQPGAPGAPGAQKPAPGAPPPPTGAPPPTPPKPGAAPGRTASTAAPPPRSAATAPGAQPRPAPAPAPAAAAPATGEPTPEAVQDTALNGAQLGALQGIVESVSSRRLPRDAAKGMIMLGFRLTDAQAEQVLASAGTSFFTDAPEVPPAPGKPAASIASNRKKPEEE